MASAMPRDAHGPACAHAARGGPACAHAAIGNGAYGTPDHTWRMNNGQAQAWWEAPDGSRYLLACVRDDDASGAHGVAVWMLFPAENVWRRVAVPRHVGQGKRSAEASTDLSHRHSRTQRRSEDACSKQR